MTDKIASNEAVHMGVVGAGVECMTYEAFTEGARGGATYHRSLIWYDITCLKCLESAPSDVVLPVNVEQAVLAAKVQRERFGTAADTREQTVAEQLHEAARLIKALTGANSVTIYASCPPDDYVKIREELGEPREYGSSPQFTVPVFNEPYRGTTVTVARIADGEPR